MKFFQWILTIFLSISLVYSKENNIKLSKCKYGDTECIKNFIQTLLQTSPDGAPEYNIPSIDPLYSNELKFEQGNDIPINMKIRMFNVRTLGLAKSTNFKVSGFTSDPNGKYELRYDIPVLTLAGSYEMNGQVLVMPITGNGRCNITSVDNDVVIKFNGRAIEKDGKKYLKLENFSYNYNLKGGYMDFTNLYNGNPSLAKTTISFLNEHWKEIFDEMKPSIRKTLGNITLKLLEKILTTTPYEDLFLKNRTL